jgi:exodeoxyribonuclease VIII
VNEIKKEPFETYLANPRMSSGKLRDLLKSPATYEYRQRFPLKQTAAMRLGTMIHSAVLEQDVFNASYVVLPEPEFKTKSGEPAKNPWATSEGKKFYADFVLANPGKQIIENEEMATINGVVKALHAQERIANLLFGGAAEHSVYFTDPDTGMECKARPDFITEKTDPETGEVFGVVVDLKTTADASFRGFQRSVAKYQYHVQAAFYVHALEQIFHGKKLQCVWLAAETKPPYHCALYHVNESDLGTGHAAFRHALDLALRCSGKGIYPGLQWDWLKNEYVIETMTLPAQSEYIPPEE